MEIRPMMQFHTVILSLWFCYATTAAAAAAVNVTEILADIPACALPCMLNALTSSPSALSDPRAICSNTTLEASISECIVKNCDYLEQEKVSVVDRQLCAGIPIQSRVWAVTIVGLISGPLALIAIALRCYSRLFITRSLGYDDWAIIAAAVVLVLLIVFEIFNGLRNGLGRHYWDIEPLRIVQGLKIFYVSEVLYITVITLIKSSILLFYLRIFPSKNFKRVNLAVLAAVLGSGISIDLAIIFQCHPIAGAWDPTRSSKCINVNVLAYAAGGISVALDLIILFIPIPQCLQLRMNLRKKLNVIFMFSIGGVACVTSIVRLKYLIGFAKSSDPTWDNAIPAIWSFLEICVATICACLPAIRAILSRWFPSIFEIGTTDYSSHSQKENRLFSDRTFPSAQRTSASKLSSRVSYSKRAINTPDDKLLGSMPPFNMVEPSVNDSFDNVEMRVWTKPKFDQKGSVVEPEGRPKAGRADSTPSSESSVWVLEGAKDSGHKRGNSKSERAQKQLSSHWDNYLDRI